MNLLISVLSLVQLITCTSCYRQIKVSPLKPNSSVSPESVLPAKCNFNIQISCSQNTEAIFFSKARQLYAINVLSNILPKTENLILNSISHLPITHTPTQFLPMMQWGLMCMCMGVYVCARSPHNA